MLTTSMLSGRPASAAAIWAKLVYTRSGARPRSAPESRARCASDDRAPATSSYCPSMRAHRRCTAPMKAPRPPPTMPSRSGGDVRASDVASTMLGSPPSGDAAHAPIGGHVGAGTGEIVERLFRDPDDMIGDELRPFARAILGVLETAFPLQHRPAGIIVLGELGEDRLEVHLAVAQRTEPSGPINPRLETAVHALAAGRVELGVLDVEHANPLVIQVDILEIVELLQHDYLEYIDLYHERIRMFHVKDAEFNPTGRQGVYGGFQPWIDRAGRFRSLGDGQVNFKAIFSKLAQYDYPGWAVLEWECCLKHPEDGAREGAKFIADHIIRVTEQAFDDFAGAGTDVAANRRMLGVA